MFPHSHWAVTYRRMACLTLASLVFGSWVIGGLPCYGQVASSVAPAAFYGEPWGVVTFEVPIPKGASATDLRVLVHDSQGRLFYPATSIREIEVAEESPPLAPGRFRPGGLVDRVRSAIRGAVGRTRVPVAVTVVALFRGEGPLDVQLMGDLRDRIAIEPRKPQGEQYRALLEQWWKSYVEAARKTEATGDHPLLAQKYLVSMLGERFHLPPPPREEDTKATKKEALVEPLNSLALLSAIEPLRDEIFEQTMRRPVADIQATHDVPNAPRWMPQAMPEPPEDVTIEAIASRVPPECLYLRFGSFSNYVWFQDLSARNGGDLAQIVLVRGFNYETSARMERMLSTRMTAVSKMFGDQLISDMAIVGRDLYMKEGASLGVLFETKNRALLMTNFDGERKATVRNTPGAKLETVEIGGRQVSLLSTPDNRVRSFLIGDGDYVFMTTSRHLAERFIQLCDGQVSMAQLPSFRWARKWMPEANQYSVFAYFSPEFFHGLVSPQFQIELRRRLEAIAHIELAEVASRTAKAEGIDPDSIEAMVKEGLLPASFDQRADGARTLRENGRWIDSLRGGRGSFLPIVDVDVQAVSAEEAERYAKLASFYESQWQQMDPMLVGLRRFQVDKVTRHERVAIEAYAAPFEKSKYGWVGELLAPASPVVIRLPDDDVVSGQALMNGNVPLTAPRQPYHLFGGIKDMQPPAPEDTKGLIKTLRALKAVPGYMGAWPGPGYLDQLPLGLGGGRPDASGFSRSIIGLWRWQGGGFSILSFDRGIIENAASQVAPLQAQDAAQARVRVHSLESTKLAVWINDQWFERSWMASQGNARLLDTMQTQFKVPGVEALSSAESLLDVKLNCPLGGKFEYVPTPGSEGVGLWSSDAWARAKRNANGNVDPPDDYVAPWIRWFRGAELHLTQFTNRLAVVGTFDVERPVVNEKESSELAPMNFDLFQLPFKIFGGDGPKADDAPKKRSF